MAESDADNQSGFSEQEVEDINERSRPRTPLIYEIVRREGEEEMRRPITSLWWSGLAAGISISFSLLAQAALRQHLPAAAWRPLVTGFGYPVGFLMVVLARQQLFTETTVTAVLPVAAAFTRANLARLARMWSVVFAANMAGTFVAALFWGFAPVLSPALRDAMLAVSHEMMANGWAEMFIKGIAAGFLIAAMVWLIPSAEATQFHVITVMTYLIAIGGFTHIRRQRRGLPAAGGGRARALAPRRGLPAAGFARQHHRRHGALRPHLLCADHEGGLARISHT